MVTTPPILVPRGVDSQQYINHIVRRHTKRNVSEINENQGHTTLKILIHKKDARTAHKTLRKLLNDLWANNILQKAAPF